MLSTGQPRLPDVSERRPGPEQNPLLLVGAFAVVAALLFGVFTLVDRGGEPDAAGAPPATTPGTTSPAPEESEPRDLRGDVEDIQPGEALSMRPERKEKEQVPLVELGRTGRVGTGLALGDIPDIKAPVSEPVQGAVTTAVANIPNRTGNSGFVSSLRALTGPGTDFVMLNEVSRHSSDAIRAAAPGYGVYRDPAPDRGAGGAGQSMNNVVMWRADRWRLVDGGRVKLVENDQGFHHGRPFTWDRYATWAILQRDDRAVVSVISTHMMTNPGKYPKQHGNPGLSRAGQYARGMDVLLALGDTLAQFGPVVVGGDMNSHPGSGSWAAAPKMRAAGYQYAKDAGVMYLFFQPGVELVSHRQVRVASDHAALVSALDMRGKGPTPLR